MLQRPLAGLLAVCAVPFLISAKTNPGTIQPMPVSPPAPVSQPADETEDTVSYESGPARYLDKQKLWQMSGGVKFSQSDTHLDTQAALVNLDSDLKAISAKSLASVHVYDSQNDLTGDHGFLDFTKHLATLKDHITLIARPGGKNSGGSLKSQVKDPATMTCDVMTYDYRKKTGTVPGALVIHQTDRVLTADSGVYNGNDKTVTLIGNVHAKQGDGNEVFAAKMIAGIEEGNEWIFIPGPITGKLKPKKDKPTTNTVEPPPAQAAPPPDLALPGNPTGAPPPPAAPAPNPTPEKQPDASNSAAGSVQPPPAVKQ